LAEFQVQNAYGSAKTDLRKSNLFVGVKNMPVLTIKKTTSTNQCAVGKVWIRARILNKFFTPHFFST
jgi:hypothetical protein